MQRPMMGAGVRRPTPTLPGKGPLTAQRPAGLPMPQRTGVRPQIMGAGVQGVAGRPAMHAARPALPKATASGVRPPAAGVVGLRPGVVRQPGTTAPARPGVLGVKRSIAQVNGPTPAGPANKMLMRTPMQRTALPQKPATAQARPMHWQAGAGAPTNTYVRGPGLGAALGVAKAPAVGKAPGALTARPPARPPPQAVAGGVRPTPGSLLGMRLPASSSAVAKPVAKLAGRLHAGAKALAAKMAVKKELGGAPAKAKAPLGTMQKLSKASPAFPPAAKTAGPPREHKDPELIKQDVKKRKVEAFTRNLLDEWCSLKEDCKLESWKTLAKKMKERVPGKFLALMANQLCDGLDPADFDAANEAAEAGPAEDQEPAADETTEAGPSDKAAPPSSEDIATVLEALVEKPSEEWNAVWAGLKIAPKAQGAAVTTLLQAAAESADPETVATFLQQLATAKLITTAAVEAALSATAAQLEELSTKNDSAWHHHSRIVLQFFPKSAQTSWGFAEKAWSWISWWEMTQRALGKADKFRAFDILVLVLQQLQEQSGIVVNNLQAFKEPGRLSTVRKVLREWGDMDENAILDTLAAYGIEL